MNNDTTEKKWISLPEFPIPVRYDNAGAYLRALVQEKIDETIKHSWAGIACRAQRLEEELDVLCQGFPENILIIKDYVEAARKAGHDVDAKMDSACASEVLAFLGVTNASPMSNGLRFEDLVARSYIETKWKSWYEYGNRLISYAHIVSGDRYARTVTHREVVGEVSFQDIENALLKGERVVLLLRHAERPPLEKDDPTFGQGIGITAKGRMDAKIFGYAIGEFSSGWGERKVTSSIMTRCRDTAREILREMIPWEEPGFGLSDILGDKSPYFGRVSERMALANKGNYREALNEYFRTGHQQGFQNLAEATDKLEAYIWNDYSRLNPALQVMVTHDINVGCFLAGRKVITQFDDSTWPHYLDSAVCFLDRYGRARYGFMRYYGNRSSFNLM